MNIDGEELIKWCKEEIKYAQLKLKQDPEFIRYEYMKSTKGWVDAMRWTIRHVESLSKSGGN